jgi:glyoxylase-like metal-dependent hydrolase (beta-lactamase superfamily II)
VPDSAPGHPEIERIVAPNPGPMTLEGTNTFVVEQGGRAFVIDPGPAAPDHLGAVRDAAEALGGIAGVLLTHGHGDHAEGASLLDAPVLWPADSAAPAAAVALDPFQVVPTPGHSPDHVVFFLGRVCFCGDLVLGEGSSFVPPDGGSLAAYLESLRRVRELDLELICPGHGPWITDPEGKLDEYLEHRLDRERRLVGALERGERSRSRLLDEVWSDVPAELRGAAGAVMQAHLEKLAAEGRLPDDLRD